MPNLCLILAVSDDDAKEKKGSGKDEGGDQKTDQPVLLPPGQPSGN